MKNNNISFEEAFAKVKNSREKVNPNNGFVNQLKSLNSITISHPSGTGIK